MIQICRAEDGESFQLNATLRDIERRGSLEHFLHQEIGVDQDAILAYLSDGTRLRTDNVRELVGAQDQTIYVFNKHYLDIEFPEVLRELRVEPPLQLPIEEALSATPPYKPSHLAAQYLRDAHVYLDYVTHTLATLHRQHEAIRIARSSLDFNTLDITDVFDGIAVIASRDLARQASLLTFVDADLDIINRVEVHVEFLSPTMRKAIEGGEKPRMLGTYVARDRMKLVADGCSRIHNDLRTQFSESEKAVRRLTAGAEVVRSTVANVKIIEDAEASGRRFHDALDKASEIAAALESPATNHDALMQELKQLDGVLRHEVEVMTCTKNDYTEQCVGALRRISTLNVDLVQLPIMLSQLQTKFRSKTNFSHIQRLHSMLYSYGATVIEIARRKEFARFFYQRAQSILEVMAKLSANERKRRQVYRGDVHGQLPFDTRGMDDPVPTIDFSPSGGKDSAYSLEREDVDAFLSVVHDVEEYARSSSDPAILDSVQETRFALEKLVQKMDNLEPGFDRIAERSLLSASRLSASRRKLTEADEMAFQELSEQLHNAEEAKAHLELTAQEERTALQREIHRLKQDIHTVELAAQPERERADSLERELHQAKAQIESEVSARRILERRNLELAQDVEGQRRERVKALGDATEQARVADVLRQELAQVRAQSEEVKALKGKNAAEVSQLLETQTVTLRNLEDARLREEDLESQIRTARAENDEVHRLLKESNMEKDRLLRIQATEHDRMLRDHIAEADWRSGQQLEDANRQLKEACANVDLTNADAMGLREELQRVELELREARHVEHLLLEDVTAGRVSQANLEQNLENSGRLLAQMLDVAIAFRNAHSKALSMWVESALPPPPPLRHDVIMEEPSPIDPSDPVGALEHLRAFDHDHFLDAVAKTGTVIRKWQKQCKEYRERAKGKISFRNFAKGDLALFLPTRNSVSKPWAAFNVSFPHYFLLATGHLAEQLKTREWIVARITSITERVVDQKDPTSNPYGLGDGIKYYMLEVEDWTQSSQNNKRRPNSRKVSAVSDPESERKSTLATSEQPPIPSGPPQAQVEDSFSATLPPTSHLFPARPRANSTPSAGPSSLSRLLAQASPEPSEEPTSIVVPLSKAEAPTLPPNSDRESSPSPLPQLPPSSPSLLSKGVAPSSPLIPPPVGSIPSQPRTSSPLRPGSRASRLSTTSRISSARPPTLATVTSSPVAVKAAATTALTEPTFSAVPLSSEPTLLTGPPSLSESLSDGMSQLLIHRRRTASYHVARASPLGSGSGAVGLPGALPHTQTYAQLPQPTASSTLATFASNWVVPFGRRKKTDPAIIPTPPSPSLMEASIGTSNGQVYYDAPSGSVQSKSKDVSASEMLKRL
ncbi:putative peripheral membrane protein [Boletus edulis]|nr:putative peripheral membrane protein [Boletus edulis]